MNGLFSGKVKHRLFKIYNILLKHFGRQGWWPADTPFEVCVGAILTQNTAWQNVERAIKNLKKRKLLSPHALYYNISTDELASLIIPVGYYNIKAKRLKNFIEFLHSRYKGSIKRLFKDKTPACLREELLSVSGIGKETADSILLYAGGIPFFVIDAYTKRVFSRLRLCKPDIPYDELQGFFMDNLPHDTELFNEYHALIVMLGKHYCKNKPLCDRCPLTATCHPACATDRQVL